MKRKFKSSGRLVAILAIVAYGSFDALSVLAAGKKPESVMAVKSVEAATSGSSTLSGKVTLSGSAPAPQKIKMGADPACMQQHKDPVMSQEVVVNGGALQYALVYVKDGISGTFPVPEETVVLKQHGCMYEPHVFGIQVGQKLEIVNDDSTLHNINCQPKSNKKFNLAQPTQGMKSTKIFDQPELGISFKCNVHPWMAAYGGAFSHPFFAVTDSSGSFSLKGLPAGTYTVEVWHEKLGTKAQSVTVADGETKQVSFSL